MKRHIAALAILGWLLAATIKNPDGTYYATYEAGWPLEFTFYFIGVNEWTVDPDGNQQPVYSAHFPVRTYVWPQPGCGPMGANACVRFDNDPEPGSVWMYEETPVWCCRSIYGAP